ncbi:MAG: hypothetical protein MI863_27660 [Desulfobacterales bacterium]|nr:hypothetical protein [Desulfobacterales bacterium]
MVELYRELGFAVKLAPLSRISDAGCRKCLDHNPKRFKALYTKKDDIEKED